MFGRKKRETFKKVKAKNIDDLDKIPEETFDEDISEEEVDEEDEDVVKPKRKIRIQNTLNEEEDNDDREDDDDEDEDIEEQERKLREKIERLKELKEREKQKKESQLQPQIVRVPMTEQEMMRELWLSVEELKTWARDLSSYLRKKGL